MVTDPMDMTQERKPLQMPDDASREAIERAAGVLCQSGKAIRELEERLQKERLAYAEADAVLHGAYGDRSRTETPAASPPSHKTAPKASSPVVPSGQGVPANGTGPDESEDPDESEPSEVAPLVRKREPSTRQARILALLTEKGPLKCAEIQADLQAQYRGVFKALKAMARRGMVKQGADKLWEVTGSPGMPVKTVAVPDQPGTLSPSRKLPMWDRVILLLSDAQGPLSCSQISQAYFGDSSRKHYANTYGALKSMEQYRYVKRNESKQWLLGTDGEKKLETLRAAI